MHMGGIGTWVTIKPGEYHEIHVNLSHWFGFKVPGSYQIHGSYYMSVCTPDTHETLWEDFVCAEFEVVVK